MCFSLHAEILGKVHVFYDTIHEVTVHLNMKHKLYWFVYKEELPTIFQNNETQSEEVTCIFLTAKLRLKNVRLTFPILIYEFVVSSFRCIWFHKGGPVGLRN